MSKIVSEIKKTIEQLKNPHLKAILLSHLLEEANDQTQLFTKQYPYDRPIPNFDRASYQLANGLSYHLPLNTVFVFAPTAVCQEVTDALLKCSNDEIANLLSNIHQHHSDSRANEWVMETIMHYAPSPCRLFFAQTIKSFNEKQMIKSLLSDIYSHDFTTLRKVLNFKDEKASSILIEALHQLDKNVLFELFKTSPFPPTYEALIDFFAENPPEQIASTVLRLLNKYDVNYLYRLIFGGSYFTSSSANLLHPIFEFQSDKIVSEFLALLFQQFSTADIEKLLTCRRTNGSNHTPLELAFQRTDNKRVALRVAEKIYREPLLKPLLSLVSVSQFNSPMHLAAKSNNTEVVAFFVEQPDAPIDHCVYSTSKGMLQIAQEANQEEVSNLLLAAPIYKWIYQENTSSLTHHDLTWACDLLTQQPDLIHCRWQEQKTLLSHAASKGQVELVSLLVAKGALPLPDIHGQTAIDEAIKNNQVAVLQTFTEAAISNETILEELIRAFLELNPPVHSYEELQRTLQHTSSTSSFSEMLKQYSLQRNDCYILILQRIAKLLSDTGKEVVLHAIKKLVLENLAKLQQEEDRYLQRNALQLQLIVLLFSLNSPHFFALLYSLEFDESTRKTLHLLLSRGLLQPAIFLRLNASEHLVHYKLLEDLASKDINALETVATVHFQKSPLTLLPPEILKELAANLSGQALFSLCEQRLNPSLIVLTIEKLLNTAPVSQDKVSQLFTQLNKELQLLNKGNLPANAQLQSLLNVAHHPQVKKYIKTILNKEDFLLKQRVQQIFTTYRQNDPLIPNSLLYDLFMEFALDYKITSITENQPALTSFLAACSPPDARQLIAKLQKNFQSQLPVTGLFVPVPPSNNQQQNLQFLTTLYDLENKKQRLKLAALINHFDQFREQAQQLLPFFENEEVLPLNHSLLNLIADFDKIASHLFLFHLGAEPLLLNDKLVPLLKTLELNFSQTYLAFKSLKKTPSLKTKYKTAIKEFEHIFSPNEIHSLCQQTQLICERIEKDSNDYAETILFDNSTITLGQLLNAKAHPEEFDTTCHQALQTQRILEQFDQSIISGILANPKREQLLGFLFHWILTCGSSNEQVFLLKNMSDLLRTTVKEDWVQVDNQINECLDLRDKISPLMLDLRVLSLSDFNTADLLTTFYETDEEKLAQFIQLCTHAQLMDLKSIATYVLTGKQQQIPLKVLHVQNSLCLPKESSVWLQQRLEVLEAYSTKVISFKLLKAGLFINEGNTCTKLENLNKIIDEHVSIPSPAAVTILVASYSPVLQQTPTDESRAFVISLSHLLNTMGARHTNEALSQIPPETVEQLVAHCLAGLNSDDSAFDVACRNLLTQLCQLQSSSSPQVLNKIKTRVGQQDLTILADQQLRGMAIDILGGNSNDLNLLTVDGVWIQRLLTSPRFIAASTPAVMQTLIERYRFISLTLKQDEFEHLNQWLKTKLAFYEHHQETLSRVEKSLLTDPNRLEHLLKKRERLLSFRADDSIRALLNQLEDNCTDLKKNEPELADAALSVLYAHYNNSLMSLRSDFLFKVADFVVSRSLRKKGDIDIAQDTLSKWLTRYLPYKNFEQTELTRKTNVSIYSAEGEKIGFVNEANQAMTFMDDTPCSLLDRPGIYPGIALYDEHRCLMGTLTVTGELKRENLFQKNTSALLIAKVPTHQLSQSPAALELLMTDIFTENTLEALYSNCETEKHPWLGLQIRTHVAEAKKPVPRENLQIIVKNLSSDMLFPLLENTALIENSEQLFEAILHEETRRHDLFKPEHQQPIFAFFRQGNSKKIFADFLQNHYNKPWFKDGLQLFAQFAQEENHPQLLGASLQLLQERCFEQKKWTETSYDALLTTLVSSEEHADILWKIFLNASKNTAIKEVEGQLADGFTSFFYKHHCMPLIKAVNEQKHWAESAQYRLLLLILAKQRQQIFQKQELRYSEKQSWSGTELKQLSQFVKRHFHQLDNPDKQYTIGKKLISELVFRCANFGQTQLFYNSQGKFDTATAGKVMERSYLHAIAAREYIPPQVKKTVTGIISKMKGWFDGEHQKTEEITELLKENQALVDWKQLNEESWSLSSSMTTLPIISAYLLNYSGETEPMIQLVKDYFFSKEFQKDPAKLHAVSQVMAKFPERNVSVCLFFTLEEVFSENPLLLDGTILHHMAQFYSYKHLKTVAQSPQLEINLIKHFGLQKKYALVQRCCDLLMTSQSDKSLGKLLQKINLEAQVESQLNNYLSSWFFSIIRFIKRCWFYGFNGNKNSSNLVSYCDATPNYTSPVESIEKIHTPILAGHTVASQLETAKKLKNLRERYNRFIEKQTSNALSEASFKGIKTSNGGLFANSIDVKENETVNFALDIRVGSN
ncbi:hypothetical protein A8135_10460 [Legionella jamestowniensis]|uniref:Dot/Icm T4SS effector n=1 Tax=Legionella jamestowniensis TaxID=455 RepID=A0ABX2XVP6_9GAMM|nr:ankyrin repeat domain-containing protein [Legionella jamestowniensis]OCH98719.1 hypothetical protein A8135_10460 [Legionella jamestowniensis]